MKSVQEIGLGFLVCAALLGCSSDDPTDNDPPPPPFAGQKIRLLVVDDPAIAAAVERLRGEWSARTGAELTIVEATTDELLAEKSLPADAVIYPSHLLGQLAESRWIAPPPETLLASEQLRWRDIFLTLRERECHWDGQTMALPLGSPVLLFFYRADLFSAAGKRAADWLQCGDEH